jgi:hypothetical protein
MLATLLSCVLRIGLIACFWLFVMKTGKPKTQSMRVIRAAAIVITLSGILVAMKAVAAG